MDKAGNVSNGVSHQWTVDRTSPTARITSGPDNLTNNRGGRFFRSRVLKTETMTGMECRLDGGAFSNLYKPKNLHRSVHGKSSIFSPGCGSGGGNRSPAVIYPLVHWCPGP